MLFSRYWPKEEPNFLPVPSSQKIGILFTWHSGSHNSVGKAVVVDRLNSLGNRCRVGDSPDQCKYLLAISANCKRLLAKSGREELLAMDALDENRDDGSQIGVNGVTTRPPHGVTKHPRMDGIAEDIHSTGEVDFGVNVSRLFGCL
jgi:hypothetical protein